MSLAFDAIFQQSPNPYMVLDRDLRYLDVNAAYERVTGKPRAELVGRGLFEIFPGTANDDGSSQADILRASLQRALDTGERDVLALVPYAIETDTPDGRVTEIRYWSATHTPIRDADGRVTAVLQHTTDVTEVHRLREALRESRSGATEAQLHEGVLSRAAEVQRDNARLSAQTRFLTDLFQQAPGFIAVLRGPDHVFELANDAYEALIGRTGIVGLPLHVALPEIPGQGFIELLDQVRDTGRAFVGRGMPVELGPVHARRQTFVDFIYQPIRDVDGRIDGIFVQGADVTERETALAAARDSEVRFRTMTNVVPQMVWSTDGAGNGDYFNQRWLDYTGVEDSEGRWNAIHPDDRDAVGAQWARCLADGTPFEAEYRLRDREGTYRWVLGRALSLRNDAGEVVRWIGTCTEIDDQKRTQEMLERNQRELEEADRQKDRFLAMLAHELRNPLAPIMTAAHLLKLAPDRVATVTQAAEIVERQANHMRELVDDLMDTSRVRRGQVALQRELIELHRILTAAVEQTTPLVERKRHRLQVDNRAPALVLDADATRLTQVVANLLNNAAKYTPDGGDIRLSVEPAGDGVRICVTDSGIGIDDAMLSRVFELFTQVDTSAERRDGGLGIGLALARSLVELHGGELRATSAGLGHGSTFELVLPVATRATTAPRPAPAV